jgi:hypothetical protein
VAVAYVRVTTAEVGQMAYPCATAVTVAPVAVRDSKKGLARASGSVSTAVAAEENDQSLRAREEKGGVLGGKRTGWSRCSPRRSWTE